MSGKKSRQQSQDEGFCAMEVNPSQQSQDEGFCPMEVDPSQSVNSVVRNQTYAGTILKLKLINFMCHENLSFEFNCRTNFFTGKNGSGKSAIQTAICIALGANAAATKRAGALKELIKTGKSSSEIELVLKNTGERAYKPMEYGDKIIVSRTISINRSSTFKMSNEKGEVISRKRKDLENMLSHLQIKVTNPISILNQDTARTFFQSTDAKKKYEIFFQGTQMDEMYELIVEIFINRRAIEQEIRIRETDKKTMTNELAVLQRKVAIYEKANSYQNKKFELEEEKLWAEVHKYQADIEKHEANLQIQNAQVEELQNTLEQITNQEQEIRKKIEELKVNQEYEKTKKKEHDDLYQKARDKYKISKITCAVKLQDFQIVKKDFENKKTDLTDVEAEISQLESLATQNNDKLLEIRRKRKELEEKLKDLRLEFQEADREKNVLTDTENDTRSRVSQVQRSISELEDEKNKLNNQLSKLNSSKDTLNIYAPYMQQLKKRIDQACAQGQFEKPPKGPLGQYIKVKDASWGPAIERFLSFPFLKSFLVDNSSDNDTLRKIMKDVCKGQKRPDIYCSLFCNKIYDKVRTNEVKYENYRSLFSAIIIDDPDVANSLIDNKSIETVLLMEDTTKICGLFENERNVPRNCSKCINKFSDLFYPAPSYRHYDGLDPRKQHRCQLLQANIDNVKDSIRENIQDTDKKIAAFKNNFGKLQQKLNECHQQMRRWSNLVDTKKKEIAAVRKEISNLEEETESDEFRLPLLKNEAEKLGAEVNETEVKLNKLRDETEEMKAEAESAKKEYEQLQRLVFGNESDISRRLDAKKDLLKETLVEKKNTSDRMAESTQKIYFIEDQIKSCQKQEEEKRVAAAQVCEERQTRSLEEIYKDFKEVQKYIDSAQEMMGASYDEMCLSLERKKAELRKVEGGLIKFTKLFEKYKQLAISRKNMFNRIVDVKTADVKIHFQSVLNLRKHQGRLTINHDKREIKIMVSPTDGGSKSIDTTSLSGGERSYSAVAFIMALWKAVDLPFYSMDEFDVFMDKLNRTVVTELLQIAAESKPKCQFLFLTPQNVSQLKPSKDLSIFQMDDPQRTDDTSQ